MREAVQPYIKVWYEWMKKNSRQIEENRVEYDIAKFERELGELSDKDVPVNLFRVAPEDVFGSGLTASQISEILFMTEVKTE